jgi:hypothetical protein
MDEDRITLERFASELTGRHTMSVRVEHGDIVIDNGGDEVYVVRALPSGPGADGHLGAGLRVYMRANAPAHAGAVATSVKPIVGSSGISKKSLNILAADDYEEYGDDPV